MIKINKKLKAIKKSLVKLGGDVSHLSNTLKFRSAKSKNGISIIPMPKGRKIAITALAIPIIVIRATSAGRTGR